MSELTREIDPVRAEALRIARRSFWFPPSVVSLTKRALIVEMYLLGVSHRWGGTSGGYSTVSSICYDERVRLLSLPVEMQQDDEQ